MLKMNEETVLYIESLCDMLNSTIDFMNQTKVPSETQRQVLGVDNLNHLFNLCVIMQTHSYEHLD